MALAKGYIEYSADFSQERLIAVAPNGQQWISEWLNRPNNEFYKIGRKFVKTENVDLSKLTFCGNYEVPFAL